MSADVARRVPRRAARRSGATRGDAAVRRARTRTRTRRGRRFELERVVEPLIAETKTLNEGIAKFYDESSRVWEDVWGSEGGDGTHMHHGYYRRGEPVNHAKAQVDMIEESLRWAGRARGEASAGRRVRDRGVVEAHGEEIRVRGGGG